MSKKPYKCVYCGRRFKKPTAHKCKDGFRKRNLKFDWTPTEEETILLEEAAKSFFEELDRISPDPEKSAKDIWTTYLKSTNRGLESILPKDNEPMPQPASPLSTQVGGDHYKKYKIQPIEFIQANGLDFIQGNIVKLATRFRDKGGKQDLEKIIHYAQILIQTEYPNE